MNAPFAKGIVQEERQSVKRKYVDTICWRNRAGGKAGSVRDAVNDPIYVEIVQEEVNNYTEEEVKLKTLFLAEYSV